MLPTNLTTCICKSRKGRPNIRPLLLHDPGKRA